MNPESNLNVAHLGQVFTPQHIVATMLKLVRSVEEKENPRFLEPSCGDGAFFTHLPSNTIGIEIDSKILVDSKNSVILNVDFFSYDLSEKFDTIIGNPPYVRYQDILDSTKSLLKPFSNLFDMRTNLYLFFIYKCVLHLRDKGELIFITPRDFLKSTASVRLNAFLYEQGSITDFIELGDKRIFHNAQPNCIIWRFEKGDFSRKCNHKNLQDLREQKIFNCISGQIIFTRKRYEIPFSSLFFLSKWAR